jgi:hypothetical protein
MGVPDILAWCQELGVTLAPGEHGGLRVSPPGVLPSHLKEILKAHKADILKVLTAPPADFLGEDPCAICGSYERWRWLDGRLICRGCLIRGGVPLEVQGNDPIESPGHRLQWW